MMKRYGPWALVTGASSGIGRGFALALAERGIAVVLVARRRALLDEVAAEIAARFRVSTRVIVLDLAAAGASASLAAAVADLEIGLLIANAGTGWIGRFDLQTLETHTSMIRLHCESTVELTARLMPAMKQRGRGGVIIVSSMGGLIPVPYYALYGGTKAFLLNWGEALAIEMQGSGVDVMVVAPGDTKTGFQEVAGEMSTRWSSVEDVVRQTLEGLGRRSLVVPGLENKLSLIAARFLPRSWLMRMVEKRQREQTPRERR